MIKKIGNKGLLLLLVLLLAVFFIARYFSTRNGENTFKTAIIPQIDTNRMNGMVIFQKPTKTGKPLPFVFSLKGKNWYISQGTITGPAQERAAQYMISQLEHISPDRLASNSPGDWKDYNVTDSFGTRVVFLYDKDTALDVIVGRFSYMPQQKQAISYIRISGQKEVYAVDGFLSMNITEDFDAWRDKKIMPGDNYASWAKLTFTYPADSGFSLKRDSNSQWVFDNGKTPDSLAVLNIINDISSQNYGSFIRNFDSSGKQALFTLRVEGKDFSPVLIKAYPADSLNKYAIHSSLNPTAYFSGSRGGMFAKIFPGKGTFFKKDFKPLPTPIKPTKTTMKR